MSKTNTVCISGHRPKKLPWGYDESKDICKRFKIDLRGVLVKLINDSYNRYLIGMAEGFDMICAEILLTLKKEFKHIKIIAVIPCINQNVKWSFKQRLKYRRIVKKADEVIILQKEYTENCMNKRNHYMVINSSVVLACFDGSPSGTKNTLMEANKMGHKILILNPKDYEL